MKRIFILPLLILFFIPQAFAASEVEDAFYDGLGIGSAGWDYGYEDDEEDAEKLRQQELEEKQREEQARQRRAEQDFFTSSVGTFDKQVSRTEKQERKVKGVSLRKNNGGRRPASK